ncbi:MAG: hypothetical protein ACAH59_01705 [Pseudobdellovibrionaceae bacterium]
MKTVLDLYSHLFTSTQLKAFQSFFQQVQVLKIPEDLQLLQQAEPRTTVVIIEKMSPYLAMKMMERGFAHCLSPEREDFRQELLASCLLLLKPRLLLASPSPFFLSSLASSSEDLEKFPPLLTFPVRWSREKPAFLEALGKYLQQQKKTQAIEPLIHQIADELFANAIAAAEKSTKQESIATTGAPIRFFCAVDEKSLMLGCEDSFGTLDRKSLLAHLSRIYSSETTAPNLDEGATGLGLKLVIDNSASVSVYCKKETQTIVACTLLLKGIRANAKPNKHFHLMI